MTSTLSVALRILLQLVPARFTEASTILVKHCRNMDCSPGGEAFA